MNAFVAISHVDVLSNDSLDESVELESDLFDLVIQSVESIEPTQPWNVVSQRKRNQQRCQILKQLAHFVPSALLLAVCPPECHSADKVAGETDDDVADIDRAGGSGGGADVGDKKGDLCLPGRAKGENSCVAE